MDIIETLEKLGFSFWQVLIVISFIFFNKEIRQVFTRINKLKIGDKEIELSEKGELIEELTKIKSEIKKDIENGEIDKVVKRIDDTVKHKLTGSLINIKNNTNYLWNELSNKDKKREFYTEIKSSSFRRVKNDLISLRAAGILDFIEEKTMQFAECGPVYELHVFKVSTDIDELVDLAQRF